MNEAVQIQEGSDATVNGVNLLRVRDLILSKACLDALEIERKIAERVRRRMFKAMVKGYKAKSIQGTIWQWILKAALDERGNN